MHAHASKPSGAATDSAPKAGTATGSGPSQSAANPDQSSTPTVLNKLQKWGDYAAMGFPIEPTKFIPMKTPLSADILSNWSLPGDPRHRLTVSDMLEVQRSHGRPVGLIIDLSNHDCLYFGDIPPTLQYRHIKLIAKELPRRDFVRRVAEAANAFWREHSDQFIAIHCAYGE